jgi:uncharacterized protein involved in exopolysaccharide biosynthesis
MERELSMKTREMELLQNTYRRRVGEAKTRLAELKLTMGPQHPEVIKAEKLVEILSTPPPSIKKMRDDEERIASKLANARKRLASASARPTRRRRTSTQAPVQTEILQEAHENEADARFLEYRDSRIVRNSAAEELANAKIQIEVAKTVLDFRYQITHPPAIPEGPIKPNSKTILAAAVVGGLFLAFFLAIFFDVKTGLILKSWQVSRLLRIPVLGEIDEQTELTEH